MLYENSRASAVRSCGCVGCFDLVYGYDENQCWACDEAGCFGYADCQRDDIDEEC